MKKKILVIAPLFALVLSGCLVRTPSRKRRSSSEQPSTSQTTSGSTSSSSGGTSGGSSGTSGTSGGSSGSSGTSSTTPTPTETRGTLDQPLTVAQAREYGMAIEDNPQGTEYDTLDSYITGIVTTAPQESSKTAGTYQFKIADSYTSTQTITFYWGSVDSGVSVPVQGDQVKVFGRLARYKSNTIELAGYEQGGIADPVLKTSAHRTVSISVNQVEHATVSNIPTSAQTGDTISFTVSPAQDYSVESVKVNGNPITETSGSYSFTVVDDATILITIVQGPVVKSALQIAYEAAIAAGSAGTTDEYTFTGTVTGVSNKLFFMQEGAYGMYVYTTAETANLAVGKMASVTAKVKTYNGWVETGPVSATSITGDGQLPNAVAVDSLSALTALNHNVLVNVNGAEFVSKNKVWSADATSQFVFKVGADNITFSFDKNAYSAANGEVLNAAVAGDKFNFSNVFRTAYNSNAQVGIAMSSTVTKQTVVVDPTDVNITSGTDLLVGGTLELIAEVLPAGASQDVEWSITSGGDYASLSGNVLTGTAAGSVVVKATAVGHADVNASTTITVTAPQKVLIESINADPASVEMRVGDSPVQVQLSILPSNYEENVVWSVKSGTAVTVSNGAISAVAAGEAVVRVEGDESGVGTDISVKVRAQLTPIADVAAAAQALAHDTPSTESYTFAGVVVGIYGDSYYLQENGYGMLVYNKATDGVAMGKVVEVTSTVKNYNALPETATVASAEVTGDGQLPTPESVSSMATLSALHVGVLANVAEATFVSKTKDWTSSNKSVRFTFTIGSDNITLNFDKNGYDADKAAIFNAAQAGDKFTFGNVITNIYQTTAQLFFAGGTSTVQKITADPEDVTITSGTSVVVGSTLTLTATVSPAGAPQDVTWEITSGSEYATLSGNVLTGVTPGSVTVKATATGHADVYDDTTITVEPLILTSLSFTEDSYSFEAGSVDMSAKVTFDPATATKSLSYSIVETGKASSITTAGVLTVVASDTSFTVKVEDSVSGLSDTCTVNVVQTVVHVTGVSLDQPTLALTVGGATGTLVATVSPADATDKSVSWSTSAATVATVANGVVTPVGAGTATITVTTTDGGHTASCEVTVSAAPVTKSFERINSTSALTSGKYLIVCETTSVAFNGSLSTLDAVANTVSVAATGTISYTAELEAITFTYNADEMSLKSSSGFYIGKTANSNGLDAKTAWATNMANTITFSGNDANIAGSGGAVLRYNKASDQTRFRYYKSSTYTAQTAIQLYKLVG